jgi:hypothetical protein
LPDAASASYPLKLSPGDSVPAPTPAFQATFPTQVTSQLTLAVGGEPYVLMFTEDEGNAAHLFIFQQQPDRFCFAGAWETVVGGNGATAHVKHTWLAPGGGRALILIRSTLLARGYFYEAKPGEACPPTEEDATPEPPMCRVSPGYSASYHLLVLDTAMRRLSLAFSSDDRGYGSRGVTGPEDEPAGSPSLVPSAQGVALTIQGSAYRWNDETAVLDPTPGSPPRTQ